MRQHHWQLPHHQDAQAGTENREAEALFRYHGGKALPPVAQADMEDRRSHR